MPDEIYWCARSIIKLFVVFLLGGRVFLNIWGKTTCFVSPLWTYSCEDEEPEHR